MSGIYKITSPTGRVYIGKTRCDFSKRFAYYRNLHCRTQPILFHSLSKYGFVSHTFEILEEFSDPVRMHYIDAFEQAIYLEYVAAGCSMLNACKPGFYPKLLKPRLRNEKRRFSEEHKYKLSLAHKGPRPWRVGVKMSADARSKMSQSKLRYFRNLDNLERQRDRLAKLRLLIPPHSAETKQKMSVARFQWLRLHRQLKARPNDLSTRQNRA